MRKLASLMICACLFAIALPPTSSGGEPVPGQVQADDGTYFLRNAAYGYARNWYNARNPHYNDFTASGGDCANFVSQCLIAGGMSLWRGTDGGGYGIYPDADRPTINSNGTIPYCDYLHQHLTRYQPVEYTYVIEGVNASIPANIAVGDVVIFGTAAGDKWSHAMTVVTLGAGDIGLAGHTTDTWDASFWGVLGGSFTCANFYHINVEPEEPFSFMVNAGTLNVRAGPGLNSAGNYYQALGSLSQYQMYAAIGMQTDASGNIWYKFWFDDRCAWCAAIMVSGNVYAKPVNQPQFEIEVTNSLNVRDGPGTGYAVAGQVFDGMRFITKGMRNNGGTIWRSFWWGGSVKWCSASYTFNATSVHKDMTRVNVGFYPSWMGTNFATLQQDMLTHLAWFSVEMNTAGDITAYNNWPTGWAPLVQRCHENGTKVLLTMTLFGSSSVSTFLSSPAARANGISNLLAQTIAGNADGIMIDLEYPPSGSDADLLAFMQELNAAFKGENLLYETHFCLMPYPWASYGFGQLPAINSYLDYYFLMGYDYFYSGSSTTGPCGALFWANNIDAWNAIRIYINNRGVDRKKLVYGIPYFGFDYPVATTGHDAPGATRNGTASSRTYNSAMSKLASTGATLRWDATSLSPWYYYQESGQWHQVWFDNATSLKHKYQVVNQLDLPGMGIWALKYDDPRTELWNAIDQKQGSFSLDTAPANGTTVSGIANISSVAWGGVTDVWMKFPGGSWQKAAYSTDIHQTYLAKYYLAWNTTGLAGGWHTVEFRLNNSYGHVSFENRTYHVDNGETPFEISLSPGWNLISIPLDMADTSVMNVFASISGYLESVKYFDSADKADPWKSYRPGGTANDLANIERDMGVWVRLNAACTLSIEGSVPTSTTINLLAGWNLVGYPSGTERTVADVLAGTGYDRVEGFMPESPYVQELADTHLMRPGEAYWVMVPADTTWSVYY